MPSLFRGLQQNTEEDEAEASGSHPSSLSEGVPGSRGGVGVAGCLSLSGPFAGPTPSWARVPHPSLSPI